MKPKTRKAMAKRVKKRKDGTFSADPASRRHLMANKPKRTSRDDIKGKTISKADTKRVRKMLPHA